MHPVFTPPCLCSTADRRVLCSTMSLLHHVYVAPLTGRFYVPPCLYSTMSMFHHVFTPPCLCSTLSLLHHVYVPPLTGGFYVPSVWDLVLCGRLLSKDLNFCVPRTLTGCDIHIRKKQDIYQPVMHPPCRKRYDSVQSPTEIEDAPCGKASRQLDTA